MKTSLTFCGLCIFFLGSIDAHELSCGPKHLRMGALVLGTAFKTSVQTAHVDTVKAMGGYFIEYEYSRPGRFYFDFEFDGAFAGSDILATQQGRPLAVQSNTPTLLSFQFRFGLPCMHHCWEITPFVGTGLYSIGSWQKNRGFFSFLAYGGGGVNLLYHKSPTRHVGIKMELFGGALYNDYYALMQTFSCEGNSFGGRLAMPIGWKWYSYGTWELTLEPFVTALTFFNLELIGGLTLGIGKQF